MPLPRNQQSEIASIKRDHTLYLNAYTGTYINPDDVLQGRGRGHYEAYEDLKKDGHAYSVLQKRYLAVVSREWKVEPASSSRADKKAADMVRYHLTHLAARAENEDTVTVGFDGLCYNLLDAILKGYKPAEIIWGEDESEIFPAQVKTRNQQRFPFGVNETTSQWEMRLLTPEDMVQGIPVQRLHPRKFFVHSYGANDDNPYGVGIGRTIWWNVFFKKQGIKFWLQFVDKFASPTALGKYPRGATQEQKNTLLAALNAIATDAGVAIPEGLEIILLEASRSGSISAYEELASYMDAEISKAVLGETLSTEMGSVGSYAAAQTHDKVSQRLAKADADLLSDTLNRTLIKWTTAYNLPNAKPPRVWREFGEQEDLNSRSQRDKTLFDMGFKLKPEAVKEIYGDDYEVVKQSKEAKANDDQFLANSGVRDTDTTEMSEKTYPSLSISSSLPLKTDFALPEKDGIDMYALQLKKETEGDIQDWLGKIEQAIAQAKDFTEAQSAIFQLFSEIDTSSFAFSMGQALLASEAAGRWEVLEESGEL
jgi:phage gp29-like protein